MATLSNEDGHGQVGLFRSTCTGLTVKIRHISIRNFRAIRRLDWQIKTDLLCLIGPGDGSKTTILDAVQYALYPTWPLLVSDADFLNCDPTQEITIEVTVSPIPTVVKQDEVVQGSFREWRNGEIHDEPNGSGELAVTVRLSIDAALEPEWRAVSERDPEGVPIRRGSRAALGMARLAESPDPHFRWGRGSSLARLVPSDSGARAVLTDVYREAAESIAEDSFESLSEVIQQIEKTARHFGAGPTGEDLQIRLDPSRGGFNTSLLGLASGEVPVVRAGLGSRRLLAAAIHAQSVPEGAVMLIDEVEHGLEPHRLIGLLRLLQEAVKAADSDESAGKPPSLGQVMLSSHSPTTIREVDADSVYVIRRDDSGVVEPLPVGQPLQGLARRQPAALLGRKVVVCEGSTEVGICRILGPLWSADVGDNGSMAHHGVVVADGGGSSAASTAAELADLDYPTLLLVDADTEIDPSPAELTAKGVEVVSWEDGFCTEQRIASDLPWQSFEEMVRYAEDRWGVQRVADALMHRLNESGVDTQHFHVGESTIDWVDVVAESEFRQDFGDAAANSGKDKDGWFKRIEHGERLGELITQCWDQLQGKDLHTKLTRIGEWTYGDHSG